MDYKKAFYSKLEDCYLGAKIKQANKDKSANKSGFTNLLDIKEKYFNYVKNYLEQRIDFQNSEDASEIYNKLFTFFDSYLNETGTPFFIDTPIYKNIYAKIYSNSKDTNLFYKTQNLYYVKSDIIFESLTLSDSKGKYNFYFDASEFKQNSDNNKSKTFFKLHSIGFDENDIKQITIKVSNQKDLFPKLSNIFKQNSNEFNEEFLKALDNNKIKINEEELKKIFRSYRKQNEIDFFIHKNAKAFLEEQFDLWMFNHLYKDSQIQQWNPNAIKRMQEVRNIAYEIIYFIAKFEDELKAIWLKPKFAKNTEYVFSLDIIINKAKDSKKLLDLIFKDKNFKNQIKEWKGLNLIDENFNISSLQGKTEEIEKYKFIPIDTKHLSREVKFELLSSFDNLEELLNGELIKSDNFQALNSIMPKYQGKIDLIYIDPPYNAPSSEIIYKNNFKDSTWLSMMENRLSLSKEFLSDNGLINIAIDDIELFNLGELCNEIFDINNHISTISVLCNPQGRVANNISKNSEFNLLYCKNNTNFSIDILKDKEKNGKQDDTALIRTGTNSRREERPFRFFPILIKDNKIFIITYNEYKKIYNKDTQKFNDNYIKELKEQYEKQGFKFLLPISKSGEYLVWQREFSRVKQELNGYIIKNDKIYTPYIEKEKPKTLWTNKLFSNPEYGTELLKNILNTEVSENTPKSIHTIIKFLEMIPKGGIVLDFFAGSGTLAHSTMQYNLLQGDNKKFILIEQGEHFYTKIIPRIKKVAFSSEWKEGKLKENKQVNPIAIAFRYYELESYEEALANCEYVLKIGNDKKINSIPYNINDYYNENIDFYEGIIDYRKSRKLIKKLNKAENKPITINMSAEYREEFDIFQTIANIMNLKIKKLFLDKNGFESCEYDNGEILNIENIDLYKYPKLKSLIWWRE